ncbi:hypothetical protein [Vibrio sp. WXL103]|uniref:hypothetical protein n=1 Tax=Vibrio sp. WXL103 TaxID=3450710 RepID=UPI003EC527AE
MLKVTIVAALVLASLSTMAASDQAACKNQALAAADAVKFALNLDAGITYEEKKVIKVKVEKLDDLLAQERYCDALQLATTR